MKQSFTTLGAARLQQDIIAIQAVVDSSCIRYRQDADLEMDKLKQGVLLLNLRMESETGGPSLTDGSDDHCCTNRDWRTNDVLVQPDTQFRYVHCTKIYGLGEIFSLLTYFDVIYK